MAALGNGTQTAAICHSEHDARPEVLGMKGDVVDVVILSPAVAAIYRTGTRHELIGDQCFGNGSAAR
jgi:hypothetical protein